MNKPKVDLTIEECRELGTELKNSISLDRIIGLRFCETEEEIPVDAARPLRDFHAHLAICQVLRMCRTMGTTVGMTLDDHFCMPGASTFGFTTFTRSFEDIHTKNREAGEKMDAILLERDEQIPKKSFKAIVVSPLEQTKIVPDMIIIYGNPGQVGRVCKCFTYVGEPVTSLYMGGVGCSLIPTSFVQQKPFYGLPAGGEKMAAGTSDGDMTMVFPAPRLKEVVENFRATQSVLPYPSICVSTTYELQVPPTYKMSYKDMIPDDEE